MVDRKLIALLILIAILYTGHALDHIARGDIPELLTIEALVALVFNVAIYGLIGFGLHLYLRGTIGAGAVAIAAGLGGAYGWFAHFSPWTEQTPQYICGAYQSAAAGWLALGCLVALMLTLIATTIYAGLLWFRQRRANAIA